MQTLICCFGILMLLAMANAVDPVESMAAYQIRTTWNNQSIPSDEYISVAMEYRGVGHDLIINVRAPFYDDPRLPDWSHKPDTFEKLYNYEVVEIFLLNKCQEHYLEIELAPRGQYLLLELHGYRNVTRTPISLKSYHVTIDHHPHHHRRHRFWHGHAVVANKDLPSGIDSFNAYAIHGTDPERKYLALFPAPFNSTEFPQPDFHRLELFQPISLFDHDDK